MGEKIIFVEILPPFGINLTLPFSTLLNETGFVLKNGTILEDDVDVTGVPEIQVEALRQEFRSRGFQTAILIYPDQSKVRLAVQKAWRMRLN